MCICNIENEWKCYLCGKGWPDSSTSPPTDHFTCSVLCLDRARLITSNFVAVEQRAEIKKTFGMELWTNEILQINDEHTSITHVGSSSIVDEFEHYCAGNTYTHLLHSHTRTILIIFFVIILTHICRSGCIFILSW